MVLLTLAEGRSPAKVQQKSTAAGMTLSLSTSADRR